MDPNESGLEPRCGLPASGWPGRAACSRATRFLLLSIVRIARSQANPLGAGQGAFVPGKAANARMPDTKIRPPATMNIRLTELRVTPANEARKLSRTVFFFKQAATTESMDASWLT